MAPNNLEETKQGSLRDLDPSFDEPQDEQSISAQIIQHVPAPITHTTVNVPAAVPKTLTDTTTVEDLRSFVAADAEAATGSASSGPTMYWSPFDEPSQDCKVSLPLVYCDQTASNRPLKSIESYLQSTCLPYYGNTHTMTSITGSTSTARCAEARKIVGEAVNANIEGGSSDDLVLFAGSGATGAVDLLLDCLGLHEYKKAASSGANQMQNHKRKQKNNSSRNNAAIPMQVGADCPIVFIGPFEHHSNLLPWRESGAHIIIVPGDRGQIDMVALEQLLQEHKNHKALKIGTFTAASNISGIVTDTNAVTAMLHKYGALSFWDYSTAAPYLHMNMNPTDDERFASRPAAVAKDAIFFAPHKTIGGIGTPGVLILKKALLQPSRGPRRTGGGTVFYVTPTGHHYLPNPIEKYEGGTPNVVGIWRVGLAMLLKHQVETKYEQLAAEQNAAGVVSAVPATVAKYEFATFNKVAAELRKIPNVVLVNDSLDPSVKHLPIFSFLIKCGPRFLHYNFVSALLNDVFGIQSRGGCQCAGPYAQELLGMPNGHGMGRICCPVDTDDPVEAALISADGGAELLRPGFTRLSLPFKGLSSVQVDYVIQAIQWVAHHGWMFLPQYRCNLRTGIWRHASGDVMQGGNSSTHTLADFTMGASTQTQAKGCDCSPSSPPSWSDVLKQTMGMADRLLAMARRDSVRLSEYAKLSKGLEVGDGGANQTLDPAFEHLRWYVHPDEVIDCITEGLDEVPGSADPSHLRGALKPAVWLYRGAASQSTQKGEAVDEPIPSVDHSISSQGPVAHKHASIARNQPEEVEAKCACSIM